MKRFHVHVGVKDIAQSVEFYSTLFGQRPSKLKDDYAKWMLEDPRVNFAISTRGDEGVDHLGFRVEDGSELKTMTERLKNADLGVHSEGEATCCYARSEKAWVTDPTGIAWETYQTMEDAEVFSEKPKDEASEESACCAPAAGGSACC